MSGRRDWPAAAAWAEQVAAWAIPPEILQQAPRSPWLMPLALFRVDADTEYRDTPSRRLAREVLADGDTVLDVGCGGGRAGLALTPPAGSLIGVDQRPQMLQAFAEAAAARGVVHREIEGSWPEIAEQVPVADVVVCHHVAYNVLDLSAFALALSGHARRRVVIELSRNHPLTHLSPLWQHFWGVVRPDGPSAETALQVLREVELSARLELWDDPVPARDSRLSPQERVELTRIRLCLPAERDPEIAEVLQGLPQRRTRPTATLWWDV